MTDSALLSVFLISFTGGIGIYAVPAALPSIGTAFSLTEARIGLVMTAFSLPTLLLLPITGILADIYGRRLIVIPSLIVFGAAGVATLAVTSFEQLLLLRGAQGAAFAGVIPLTQALVGDLYTGPEGSAAQGIRMGLTGFASMIAPLIAGVLAAIAWSYPFIVFGFAFPTAVLVYLYYPEPIANGGRSSTTRLREELWTYWRDVRVEATDAALGLLLAGGFVLFFLKQTVLTFMPVYAVQSVGINLASAGLVLSLYGLVRVLISPMAGLVMAQFGRTVTTLGGLCAIAIGVGTLPLTSTYLMLAITVGIYAIGEAILNPVITDAVATFASDDHRGGIMSALGLSKEGALTVAPIILGFVIASGGFKSAFLLAAAVALCYAAGVIIIFSTSNLPVSD